jgi:uncharacterized protein
MRQEERVEMSDGTGVNSESPPAITSAAPSYAVGSETSLVSVSGLDLRAWPVLATIGLGVLVILPAGPVFVYLTQNMGMERYWALTINHAVMLAIALALIAWLARRKPGRGKFSEYGLQWPKEASYVWPALLWGLAFGVLMTIVDWLPQILRHLPPSEPVDLRPRAIGARFFFEGIFVGPTEEIPFRGLMQTFLMQRSSGRVRFLKYEMHVAGVVLALLFALAHLTSFWTENVWIAMGQQIYAFALGILYAYWREKSGSVLAPSVGHNVGDGVEYLLTALMAWAWR